MECSPISPPPPADLDALEAVFDGLYTWLGRLWDPASGGFYYQLSSLEDPQRFAADIESTGQAVRVLARAELLSRLHNTHRLAIADFIKRHQHPDGFFRAGDGESSLNTERMLGRYLDYCRVSLELLEASPRFPLPKEFSTTLGEQALRPAALEQWVDARDWSNPWRALDEVSSRVQILENVDHPAAALAIQDLIRLINERQDPTSGLWGGGEAYVQISGAFKAVFLYARRQPFPRSEQVYASLMRCVRQHPAPRVTWISNALNLFMAVEATGQVKPTEADRHDLLHISTRNLRTCLRSDGGFSVTTEGSWAAPNDGIVLGQGRVEGDMNSAGLASQVWLNLHKILRLPGRPPRGAQRLFDTLATPRTDPIKTDSMPQLQTRGDRW